MKSKYRYTAPFKVSWKMRQIGGKRDECGVLQALWDQNRDSDSRHASYNSGLGWWVNYFGYGYDTAIQSSSNYVSSSNLWTHSWYTMTIDVNSNNNAYYTADGPGGSFSSSTSATNTHSGFIMMGHHCMHFEFKEITVEKNDGVACNGDPICGATKYTNCRTSGEGPN